MEKYDYAMTLVGESNQFFVLEYSLDFFLKEKLQIFIITVVFFFFFILCVCVVHCHLFGNRLTH